MRPSSILMALGLALLSLACESASTLVVQVRTDLGPGVDFDQARVDVSSATGAESFVETFVVADARSWGRGVRVAERSLPAGDYRATISLELEGATVVSRPVRVTLDGGVRVVTVLLTRDCVGVMCPLADGDPSAAACLGGRCVPETCSEERPDLCGEPECATDSDCPPEAAPCARGTCSAGSCFVELDHDACSTPQICELDAGCIDPAVPSVPTFASYLKASNAQLGDAFGSALAADGDTLVVGAPGETSAIVGDPSDNSAVNAGAVYVFRRVAGAWVEEAYLKASNVAAEQVFGTSVAVEGDTLVVGAPGDGSTLPAAGAAFVFERSGGVWTETEILRAPAPQSSARFGTSVAISGTVVVVGAPDQDRTGVAFVFGFEEGTGWPFESEVRAPNADIGDTFGTSIAISADTLVVGAPMERSIGPMDDDSQPLAGAVYVFRGTGVWALEGYLKATMPGADGFGIAVAIDGDRVVVGAPADDGSGTGVNPAHDDDAEDAGAVFVFERVGTSFGPATYLKGPELGTRDLLGLHVSLVGDLLLVGAPREDGSGTLLGADPADDGAIDAGGAFLFTARAGSIRELAYIKAHNTGPGDGYGSASAIGDGFLAIGASVEGSAATGIDGDGSDDTALAAGAVYVYSLLP